ncbi:pentatricopeptide repeat-containing protein [Senna tora]|uniref:Pentatricopeptide repeat-containing protein n=1 Tax=Senna tora TaxID=362788 RepID=A0A835CEL0_9FABA|nr:pentatricopeptide repeat-containing protein [Senna tora]
MLFLLIFHVSTLKHASLLPTIQSRFPNSVISLHSTLSINFLLPIFKFFSTRRDVYYCNVRIASLARDGNLNAARKLFDKMPTKDVVTWNTMVTGYWQSGLLEESRRLFELMPLKNVVSWNSMIAGCVENEMVEDAFGYFLAMPEKNTASYNAMISGFVKFDRILEAEGLFETMPSRNVVSYTAMIDGYARKGDIRRAREVFDEMPLRNAVSWTVMISGLVENGLYDEARKLYEQMPQKNIVAMTAMMTGYCKEGKMEDARALFEEIQCRDRVSWNAMITGMPWSHLSFSLFTGYAQNENGEEAMNLFSQMVKTGMQPDDFAFVAVFTACSSLASLEDGRQAYALVIKHGFESNNSVCNALITMYSKCGGIHDSELAFGQISQPDLVSWNTIIAAFAQHGLYHKSLTYFNHMITLGVDPNGITFLSLLSACCHTGKIDESMNLFNLMVHHYDISPRSEHYACLVDIMGRAGKLERACKIIQEMPLEADSSIWGALLAACSVHLNVELGEVAAKRILHLDPCNSGAYVMLSNIYAAAGKWKDVNRVRILMKDQGVKKQRACSWVQIGNKIHCFLGGDASHPNIIDIHITLRRISLHMRVLDDTKMFFM